jgi:hypothetical protein
MPATVGGKMMGARTIGRKILVIRLLPLANTHASGTPNTTEMTAANTELHKESCIAEME